MTYQDLARGVSIELTGMRLIRPGFPLSPDDQPKNQGEILEWCNKMFAECSRIRAMIGMVAGRLLSFRARDLTPEVEAELAREIRKVTETPEFIQLFGRVEV